MSNLRVQCNTSAHQPFAKDFVDCLRDVERREGLRMHEVMSRWLEAAFRAIRGRYLFGEAFEQNEAGYMKIVERCREPKETMDDLAVMLGIATEALAAEPIDFLGPIFSEISASSSLGQFFTPHALSEAMARMMLADAPALLESTGRGYLLCQEPACGVGGMVLASNLVLREQGLNPARQVHWVMVDVDFSAMCGAFLQCALTDASATAIHGNTLSLEQWLVTSTPAAILFPKRTEQSDKRAPGAPAPMPELLPSPAPPQPAPAVAIDRRGQMAFSF